MADWHKSLDGSDRCAHFVQLYSDEAALARNVGLYLCEGLAQGESGIVIAASAHRAAFRRSMESAGIDPAAAEQQGRLCFQDAEQTLARFMVDGVPDGRRFEETISAALRPLARRAGTRIRAYGEMVGILWASGEYSAAINLEECWNRILDRSGVTLFCAYPIDVFSREFQAPGVHAILCDHTHMLPTDEAGFLERALNRAVAEVAGSGVCPTNDGMTDCPPDWGAVPPAERLILWVRKNLPNSADEILRRASREYKQRAAVCAS